MTSPAQSQHSTRLPGGQVIRLRGNDSPGEDRPLPPVPQLRVRMCIFTFERDADSSQPGPLSGSPGSFASLCENVNRQNDQTQSLYFGKELDQQSKVSSSGNCLEYNKMTSVCVRWMKTSGRCVAPVMCCSAHQGLDCIHSESSSF